VVQCTINEHDVGRRTLKRWDESRWFVEVTAEICRKLKIDTGSVVTLALTFIKDELPDELQRLFLNNKEAELAWIRLGQSRQRQLLESLFAAKKQETRDRRVAHIKAMLADLRTVKG
jgi:hypothetical protein